MKRLLSSIGMAVLISAVGIFSLAAVIGLLVFIFMSLRVVFEWMLWATIAHFDPSALSFLTFANQYWLLWPAAAVADVTPATALSACPRC